MNLEHSRRSQRSRSGAFLRLEKYAVRFTFWAAVIFPIVYFLPMVGILESLGGFWVFLGLISLHLSTLLIGRNHRLK